MLYLQNYKEFEAEILDLHSEKYGLSFDIKKYTTSGGALGDENVIGIRAFNLFEEKISPMHPPKVAGKYSKCLFYKMAANAILKNRKCGISLTRLAKRVNKVSFPTNLRIANMKE